MLDRRDQQSVCDDGLVAPGVEQGGAVRGGEGGEGGQGVEVQLGQGVAGAQLQDLVGGWGLLLAVLH
jgi:hypothetical protein